MRRMYAIISSSFKMALLELWKNKLRTFLSLRGYEARTYTRGDELLASMKQAEPPDVRTYREGPASAQEPARLLSHR